MEASLIPMSVALALAGCAAGFSAGLFGIGGGAIMVPVLYYVFSALGFPPETVMHCSVATSSAVIIISSIRSVMSHHAHQAVDWDILWPPAQPLRSWGLWIAIGSLAGSAILAQFISGPHLTLLFGSLMCLIALQFIFGRPDWRVREDLPGGLALPLGGGTIGSLSALMGIGGGAISVSLMVMCGKSIHRAIGTASGVGMFISIPATLGFIYSGWSVADRPLLSLGYVNLLGFIFIGCTSLIFIPLGARVAHSTDQRRLKSVFGIFLLLVSINMIRKTIIG